MNLTITGTDTVLNTTTDNVICLIVSGGTHYVRIKDYPQSIALGSEEYLRVKGICYPENK